ncbi:hypothetical protein SUGI_0840890 [Cryptomeria japonica]|uniref:disease resistance protein RPV1 n=1 Tax=Cryptomeria japonica TaxID=3369 RepID=UPI002414737A|nr:disease resistance protein RPV1 [Cryptomeria japonica]GLJ40703.1 hypothetical protein SUGI_0840890 [Cryptomeria japonica]
MEQYKPPSAKLAFHSNKRYHVFLSFRGEDVRKSLVDHLFQALSAAGLNVFLDSHKLEKGEIIGLSLERAIESSAIRIPIFSRGYADSAWCLKEAAAMLKSPGLIIPLFYHVNPTHVRYPENECSPYYQSFLKHYSYSGQYPREEIEWWKRALLQICPCLNLYDRSVRYRREEIDEWKLALRQICSRSGWSLDLTEGYEARLVKTVVNDLIKTLHRVPLEVAKHPVGMDSLKNALIQKLNLHSVDEVVKIGIWGIGGIGKTTVAKALYNQLYADFEAASFVSNVRITAADATGLTNLQKQIFKDLTKYDDKVDNVDQGISLFRDRLGGRRVLLILDDVDAVEQLYALVGDWLDSGSRVIITSRDKHILNVAQVSSELIHEISGLEIDEGLQLFSWHAFLKASPNPSHRELSKRIVEACKGHPLSLEVIGSFLYDKQNDICCWTEALHNITLNPEIHKRLYISYGALSDEEKEIFMDIACFFVGEEKTCAIVFWKSLYKMVDTAISNLSMKLLIKIDEGGVFDMHDHLRDMGRTIAEKEKERTRLWEAAHLSTISNNTNFSRLRINGGNPQRLEMLYRPGLRYLHLKCLHIKVRAKDALAMLPPSLIWLRLEYCGFDIERNKARKKEPSHSRFEANIWQLKIMQLQFCNGVDSLTLDSLFSLPNIQLQHLKLCGSLNNLPNAIGNLSQLQHLNLRGCESLNNLPYTIGNLSQLQHLNLRGCGSLNNLVDTIGNLTQLKLMELRDCKSLNSLPDTIGNLSQLQHLDLKRCVSLNNLPNTIGNMSQLQHLDLEDCGSLNNLPDTIGNLSQLQHLDLEECGRLINLPDTIGNLSQLQYLGLGKCESLNELPDTIGNLSQLQHFDLRFCGSLSNIPNTIGNLRKLQFLDLEGCKNLNNLPDTFGNLSQMQRLDLGWCLNLNKLPETIGNLLQLQHLDLGWCISLNSIPDTIGNLSHLQYLDLRFCKSLNDLPNTFGYLSQLQHLDLGQCESLNNLPHTIGSLSQLQHLDLRFCKTLNKLPDTIANLSQLQYLDLRFCGRLNNLPNTITNLSHLHHLDVRV